MNAKKNYLTKKSRIWIFILSFSFSLLVMTSMKSFGYSYQQKQKWITKEDAEVFKNYFKSIQKILKRSENCDNYFESLASAIFPISSYISLNISGYYNLESYSESSPKLAISYLIHSNPGLFEILFHLMFRPQNSYCIAIDLKSSEEDQNCFHSVIKCYQEKFPNTKIFIIQDDPIYYKGYSILDADLNCLEILYNASSKWSYYLNMAGSEFPMHDLDDFFSKIKIPFSIESYASPGRKTERWTYKYNETSGITSEELLPPVPYNLTIFKGDRQVILSREYTNFILNYPVPIALRDWMEETLIPDESYFPTLARISYMSQEDFSYYLWKFSPNYFNESFDTRHKTCHRYSQWAQNTDGAKETDKCYGRYNNYNCVFAMQDLKEILKDPNKRNCLVANKFNLDVDPRPVCYLARMLSPLKPYLNITSTT